MDSQQVFSYIEGWGNVYHKLPNYQVGSCDIFKRDKVDEFDSVSTAYHDRLQGFDAEKYDSAVKESGVNRDIFGATLEQIDTFLTAYFGYPCRTYFVELQRGYNGYDYIRMDYQYTKKIPQSTQTIA
ncbi:MAG: hypothetical protein EKK63_12150 [Acinetobacter sp.]|uniref:hypothetical protein n=1 Tax=Acinetobacter sp. TaxID=472 RepID=UPI000FADDE43|nr:hypothetical protein [Acinetobacter sp.]RUP38415.1 MAG: hypothetical protein EKK63_12150 [Acinetobacter sp.]